MMRRQNLTVESRLPDSYHTCYTLTGLSALQYHHYHTTRAGESPPRLIGGVFSAAFSWKFAPSPAPFVLPITDPSRDADPNRADEFYHLTPFHPLYVIPHHAAETMRAWNESRKLVFVSS
jgi:protein farnesyltransferase subunit beta